MRMMSTKRPMASTGDPINHGGFFLYQGLGIDFFIGKGNETSIEQLVSAKILFPLVQNVNGIGLGHKFKLNLGWQTTFQLKK